MFCDSQVPVGVLLYIPNLIKIATHNIVQKMKTHLVMEADGQLTKMILNQLTGYIIQQRRRDPRSYMAHLLLTPVEGTLNF